jgi:hypothetical protein
MPVVLTSAAEVDRWLEANAPEALMFPRARERSGRSQKAFQPIFELDVQPTVQLMLGPHLIREGSPHD